MMNIQTIEDAYYLEHKRENALEAERTAHRRGDIELAKAYEMIADLLLDKLRAENDQD